MELSKLNELVNENISVLEDLEHNGKYIISALRGGTRLSSMDSLAENASLLPDETAEVFSKLINSNYIKNYPTSVLIDFSKTVELYISSSLSEEERVASAFLMSRVNFMGTDGIRGKVVLDSKDDFITALQKDNAFTPELVETTSYSFAKMVIENGIFSAGDSVVIGNDGRDKAYDWKLNDSVISGFNRAGLDVIDMGIVPTAIVPFKMFQKNIRGGAVLTASHNPSNQNGIKFFIDGKKLLPEGENGDYVLSANMYKYCYFEKMDEPSGNLTKAENVLAESVEFIMGVLPENISEIVKGTKFILDTANGSFYHIAQNVMDKIGADYELINEIPEGANINRSCGVAEIEGTELFEGKNYDSFIPFVKKIFAEGRSSDPGNVFGITLDGDGDRGFLMYYEKKSDSVHVLDGDKCGYILSEFFIKDGKLNPKDYWFISTIESDIMTATSAAENLGLNKQVVSVGDKWICNFTKGKVLVGLEISGHLIFPISVKSEDGSERELLSGVGLLTGLMSFVALKGLNLDEDRIIKPFEPGLSNTNYVFFVDKTKFYRNSSVWMEDCRLIEDTVDKLKSEGLFPETMVLEYEEKEDPNVLYVNFIENGKLLGCIFIRNSGTEDKNATYVKGSGSIKDALLKLGKTLQLHQADVMKNENRVEYKYEKIIMSTLKKEGDISFADVKSKLESELNVSIIDSDLYSVVYGLKKERRISLEDNILKLL